MSVHAIAETNQYLTFQLEEEVFAMDIGRVREVMDFTEIITVTHWGALIFAEALCPCRTCA
ncbi:MAG: hypothetical protein ACP5SH_09835 [Syntrophobacteraceae bacterium]